MLQVTLPTNFKVAPFGGVKATAMLKQLQQDIEAIRYPVNGAMAQLPVKLKVHDCLFLPLAKWSMLLAGNCRCVQAESARSIAEAVHSDTGKSRQMYDWVKSACRKLGASNDDLARRSALFA